MDAVKKQLDCFTHTCHQVVPYENYVELAERLNKAVPGNFANKTIFVSTGAEASSIIAFIGSAKAGLTLGVARLGL
jgi:4-aminobutyrate aminotransferase